MNPTTRQPLFFKPMVAPLLALGLLLLTTGLSGASLAGSAVGVLALVAAAALQRRSVKQTRSPFVC